MSASPAVVPQTIPTTAPYTIYVPAVFYLPPNEQIAVTPTNGGTLVSADGAVRLEVPSGAVDSAVTITYRRLPATSAPGFADSGLFFALTATEATGKHVTHFKQDLTLKLHYGDRAATHEAKLKTYFLDERSKRWIPLPSKLDPVANVVTSTSNHFTQFALLAAEGETCADADVGTGAPDQATTDAFIAECEARGGLAAFGGAPLEPVYAVGNGYYAQNFPDGTLLSVTSFFFMPTDYMVEYADQGGPGSWLGLPVSELDPGGPPRQYQDEGHNFTGQPVIYFEQGFIGSNGGTIESHQYYPEVQQLDVTSELVEVGENPDQTPKYAARVSFSAQVDPAPKGNAGANVSIEVQAGDQFGLWSDNREIAGVGTAEFTFPELLPITQTVKVTVKASRLGDGLIGYAPCTAFTDGTFYQFQPQNAPLSFPFACEGGGGGGAGGPPPDTTPPTIHYVDVFSEGGATDFQAQVTDNRAVKSVTLSINGSDYPMESIGSHLYEVIAATDSGFFHLTAVDTSGNTSRFPASGELSIAASQGRNFGASVFCKSCPPGYQGATGDPVNTQNGNFTDATTDLIVEGVGQTELEVTRTYNSLAAFGSGGGTTRYSAGKDGSVQQQVVAGPPQYFGRAWTFPYAVRMIVVKNKLLSGAQVFYPDGRVVTFKQAGSAFTPSTPFSHDELIATGGGYELRHKQTLEVEVFDAAGQLIGRKDRNGNTITLTYNGEQLARVENQSGRWLTFEYDGDGFITAIHAPEGKTLRYTYQDGDLVAYTDARGNTTRYRYSDKHQLIEVLTAKGHPKLRLEYDDQGRVARQIIGRAESYTLTYSDDGSLTTMVDSLGHATYHSYDDKGRLIQAKDALNFSEFYGYDDDFNRTSFTDRSGREWRYTFDERGNKLTEAGPLSWRQSWSYNDLNRVTRAEDTLGRVTELSYDDRGNLTTTKNANGDTSAITYDQRGLPTAVRDFNGNRTTNSYDSATGDLIETRNGEGDTTRFTYDALGRIRTLTNGRGFTYTSSYDGNDNLLAVTGPLGQRTAYEYDANNNRTKAIDPNGGVTETEYDASEKVIAITTPLGFSTQFAYDDMNHQIQLRDAAGRVWSYAYDAVYNRIAEHGPEDTHSFFHYNGVRNLTDETRCNSALVDGACAVAQTTHVEYDELDRVARSIKNFVADAPTSADTNVITTYTYDGKGNLLSLTDANGNSTTYSYDALDRLVRQEDAAAQVTAYTYDALGQVVRAVNPRGYAQSFTYDRANRLQTMTDAASSTWSYAYDHNGNLVSERDPHGVVTSYAYDELDRIGSITRNFVADASATVDRNVTTRFSYDLVGNLRFVDDPRGTYRTEHRYDADNRRVLTIDAEGEQTTYAYDPVNNLLSLTDANSYTTTFTYDGLNRRTTVTNPEGHRVQSSYDRLGNMTRVVDARGNASAFTYDGLNRVIEHTDALAGVWQYVYDPMSNLLRSIDANGHADTYTYDLVYRLLSQTDAENYTTSFTYDQNNNRLTLTDGNGHTTTSTYDPLDRLATVTNAEQETTTYQYDALGNQTRLIEADAVVTRYDYDPLYRLASVTLNARDGAAKNADTNVDTHYQYDHVGNLIATVNAEGHTTYFNFDGLNRLIREIDALGHVWAYQYDPVGNRTVRVDAKSQRTDYSYYPDNQLKQTRYHDGTSIAYTYDENNNRLTMVDHLGTSQWTYDALNRVTDTTDALQRRLRYTYDQVSNQTALTYPDGRTVGYAYLRNNWLQTVTDPDQQVTSYERDGVGQVLRTTNPNNTVSQMTYDKANRLLTLVNQQVGGANKLNSAFRYTYNKVGHRTRMEAQYGWRQPGQVTSTYTYDPLRRLVRDEDSTDVWTEYTFDRVGNRLQLRTNDDSLSPRPFDEQTLSYSYNAINQVLTVIGATHPERGGVKRTENTAQAIHAFRHEVAAQQGKQISQAAADRLLTMADALLADLYSTRAPKESEIAGAIAALRTQVQADRASGAIANDGIRQSLLVKLNHASTGNSGNSGDLQTTTFIYDANGNRINKEFPGPQGPQIQGTDYRYDPENRLVEALDYQMNDAGNRVDRAVTRPDYDGDGRRLIKVYDPKTGGGGAKRVEYAFDGLDPVSEYNIWNPQSTNYYRGDANRIVTMHNFPSGSQGQKYWFHYDGLGSTSGLTKQSGQSSHNYRYEPYGQIELPNGNFTDPHNHYTFTGQELDDETGLYHFYARDYDPIVGVWMQQDTYRGQIREPKSLHRYGYVENNPSNFTDWYGFIIDVKYDPNTREIRVTASIELYGSEATDNIAQDWKKAIEGFWNNHEYKGRNVVFDVNIFVGNEKCKQGQNCVEVANQTPCAEPEGSCVQNSRKGYWWAQTTDRVVAHEFGHMCNLTDDYETIGHWEGGIWIRGRHIVGGKFIRDKTPTKTGHEFHLMGDSNYGDVAQHEIEDIIPRSIKNQINNEDNPKPKPSFFEWLLLFH